MRKLIFQELMIVSDSEKSAGKFLFGPRMNLILGKKNKVGKTSLCTSLFWALGCKPIFPPQWEKLSIKTCVKFLVGENSYSIVREKNCISIKCNDNKAKKYDKVTGDFARDLSDILNFNAYLKPKGSKHYHPAFPSAQFLPAFIHSDTGWGEVYKSFSDLDGYSSTEKKYITEYLIGIRGDDFFKPRKERSRLEQLIEKSEIKIGNYDEVFSEITKYFSPDSLRNEAKDRSYEFNKIDLLLEDRSFYNRLIVNAKAERYDLRKQIELLKKAESDLFLDYQFATNNIEDNSIICPTCGVCHDNDILSRFNILDERESLVQARLRLNEELDEVNIQIDDNVKKVKQLSAQIIIEEKILDLPPSIDQFIYGNRSAASIIDPVIRTMIDVEKTIVDESNAELDRFPKFKNNSDFKKHMSVSKEKFSAALITNLHTLNVFDADETKIMENPYQKIHVSGSDISRMTLAYYKTLNDFIRDSSECLPLPMVIDSPIQQEQDEKNIVDIVAFLEDWSQQQLLIFGKDYPQYSSLKKTDGCQLLDMSADRKILSTDKYQQINEYFMEF